MTIPITGQPPIPALDDPANFNTKALNLLTWLTGSMLDQFNAVDPADWFGANQICPPGAISFIATATTPFGWLKANGAAVDRTTYSALFAVIGTAYGVGDGTTTFNLPDWRGEFFRALDDGRGIDTGRVLGSAQGDLVKAHTHSVTGSTDTVGNHTHTYTDGLDSFGTTGSGSGTTNSTAVAKTSGAAGSHSHTLTGTAAANVGTENRPRNIALPIYMKY